MSYKDKVIKFFEFENPEECFALLTDSFCSKFERTNEDSEDEFAELQGIRLDSEHDFVDKFIPFIHNNDKYDELADRVKQGFEISINPLHSFFRYHPQYKVWKKLATALNISIPSINCYDFDVIAIPFWLDMINDLGYEEILKEEFPFRDTTLELMCKDMQNYEKYNAMRENDPFPENKLKYFEWRKEH